MKLKTRIDQKINKRKKSYDTFQDNACSENYSCIK